MNIINYIKNKIKNKCKAVIKTKNSREIEGELIEIDRKMNLIVRSVDTENLIVKDVRIRGSDVSLIKFHSN